MTDTIINELKAEDQTRSKYLNPERRWVLGFALLVMLITTLPYLLGYWAQGETWRFTGFVFGVEDGNSYIAKMLRGAAGDFLFRTPFTAYHQEGVLAFPLYIILGKLTSPPGQHQQLIALYHLARILGGLLMIMATYDFIAVFVQKVPLRRWGVVLVSLGGGLGWLLLLFGRENWLGSLPLEFYSPESFGFLHLFGLPHLTFARALLLYGFIFYLNSDNIKNGLLAGLLWLLVGFFQPLNIVIAWAVTGIHIVFLGGVQLGKHIKTNSADWENFRSWLLKGLGAVAVSSPIVIYTMVAFGTDPVIKQWTSQNLITSPHPLHYLLAYGLILGLIALGNLEH